MIINENLLKQTISSTKMIGFLSKTNYNEIKLLNFCYDLFNDLREDLVFDGLVIDCFITQTEIGIVLKFTSNGILQAKVRDDGYEDDDISRISPVIPSPSAVEAASKKLTKDIKRDKFPNTHSLGSGAFFNSKLIRRQEYTQEWYIYFDKKSKTLKYQMKPIQK